MPHSTTSIAPRRLRPGATAARLIATGSTALALAAALLPGTAAEAATTSSVRLTPGASAVTAGGARLSDGKAKFRLTVPRLTRGTLAAAVMLRENSAHDTYRTRVSVTAQGRLTISLVKVRNGRVTVLAKKRLATTAKPGATLWVQGRVLGSDDVRLSVRSWVQGRAVPGWQLQATDSSTGRLTGAGTTRGWLTLSAKASPAVTVRHGAVLTARSSATTTGTGSSSGTPVVRSSALVAKRSTANTGVRTTALTKRTGDITVTKAGTVLDRLDIHGFVTIKAPNVTISNSIIRGGRASTNKGLLTNYGYDNLVVKDTTLKASYPSVWLDGIKGWDFTALRVHVTGNVDSVKIQGDNVTIQDSLLENTTYYRSDPNQGGKPSHNDNVQVLKGSRITIAGSTIRGAQNFAILGAANQGTAQLTIKNNWLDGGYCTLKLQSMNSHRLTASVTGNSFGPNRTVSNCAFQAEPQVSVSYSGNTFAANGRTVTPLRKK